MIKGLSYLATALLVLSIVFKIQVLYVDGNSMSPSLSNNDILIAKPSSNYEVGDIVTFYMPEFDETLVKRIVGVSGDEIKYINPINNTHGVYKVKDGEVFVEGDNYYDSIDSRVFGAIKIEDIDKKVIYDMNWLPSWLYFFNLGIYLIIFVVVDNLEESKDDEEDIKLDNV